MEFNLIRFGIMLLTLLCTFLNPCYADTDSVIEVTIDEVEKSVMLLQDLNIKNIKMKTASELKEEYPSVKNIEELRKQLIDKIIKSSLLNNPDWIKLKSLYKKGDKVFLHQFTPWGRPEVYELKRGYEHIYEFSQPVQ